MVPKSLLEECVNLYTGLNLNMTEFVYVCVYVGGGGVRGACVGVGGGMSCRNKQNKRNY
jgi:hypothetical protein